MRDAWPCLVWMRLPDIVGVELVGQRQAGITATDIVLALTEFLRKERVVGAYVSSLVKAQTACRLVTAPPSPT
jgi:homoaconitase/3-isopropylmalate dehydratase large subunit